MVVKISPKIEPPLENGDRLTRDEFHRRYEAMPKNIKAELIEGVVYMASPARYKPHGKQDAHLTSWLGYYSAFTPGTGVGVNSTILLDLDNEPQPDSCMIIESEKWGQVEIDDGYIVGASELVGEIAASSASYDLGAKLRVYRRNKVREYIVWRVYDETIDWFILRGNAYKRIQAKSGIRKSEIFPGLWLDSAAMLRGDLATVFNVVEQGLATPEHAEFVKRLKS